VDAAHRFHRWRVQQRAGQGLDAADVNAAFCHTQRTLGMSNTFVFFIGCFFAIDAWLYFSADQQFRRSSAAYLIPGGGIVAYAQSPKDQSCK
jgi:hypothetical protein